MFISDEQHALKSKSDVISQGFGDPNILTLPVKKLNLQEKTAVDESAWIKTWLLNIFLIVMSHK